MSEDIQPEYRVYCHDGVHKVVSAEWIEAVNDEEAIAAVQELYARLDCEIWRGRRLIAKLASGRARA